MKTLPVLTPGDAPHKKFLGRRVPDLLGASAAKRSP